MTAQILALRLSPLLLAAAQRGDKATSITRLSRAADLTDEDAITGTDGGFHVVWDELARLVPEVELLSTPYRDAGDTRDIRLRPTAPAPTVQLSRPTPRLKPYDRAVALAALTRLWEGRPDAPYSARSGSTTLRTLCAEAGMEAPADFATEFNALGCALGSEHALHGRSLTDSRELADGRIEITGDVQLLIEHAPSHVVREMPGAPPSTLSPFIAAEILRGG